MQCKILLILMSMTCITISACVSNASKEPPTSVATSTIDMETLLADPNYMAGCKAINPNLVDEQASYKGIYPGTTTQDEVKSIVGKPLRVPHIKETVWEYDDISLIFEESRVSELDLFDNPTTSLNDLILKYGCPNAIYAFAPYEDIPPEEGSYSTAVLMYPSIGLTIYTAFPTSLAASPTTITFISPTSLESLIKDIYFPKTPVSWDELMAPMSVVK